MIMKKFACVWMSFIMIILLLPITSSMDVKASKLRLNYAYYKMTGGYTVKLKTRSGKKAKWRSTNKKVATVSKNGKVTGKKKGKCYIIAKRGKRVGKCKITVTRNIYVANKKFTKTSLDVLSVKMDINTIQYDEIGQSYITGKKSTYPLSLRNSKKKPKWKTKNSRIATISSKGVITAVAPGETQVYAKVGKKKYNCKVTVTDLKDHDKIENQKDAYEMLRRINDLRIKRKCKPLKILNRLMRAANARAKEIRPAKIEVDGLGIKLDSNFRHARPDGRSFSTILPEFNLPQGSQVGENISFVTDTVTQREDFMNYCFKAFLASKDHKENMLNREYDYIGIGHDNSIHFINYHTHPCIAQFWDQLFYSKY